ncbi:MAG: Hpt domain-containing protein [Polyangiaceae bacterium]
MTPIDPELTRLLIQELSRHLKTLEAAERDPDACRRAVHALKGSAGLAGELELSASLQRLEARVREADHDAIDRARDLVRTSIELLSSGKSAATASWPIPPADLSTSTVNPSLRAEYTAEITDRLRGIDDALEFAGDPVEAAAVAFRHLHTMKSSASAVGDELTSWFCHGLEERLKSATYRDAAVAALQDVAKWRTTLGALLDDPAAALRTLRGAANRPSAVPSQRGTLRPEEERAADDRMIRVDVGSIERLMANVAAIGLAREPIARHAQLARKSADRMRRMEARLVEALRLIGPPRPWGAPAAALQRIVQVSNELSKSSDDLEQAFLSMHGSALALRDDVIEATRELSAMRQTPLKGLFSRLASAVEAEARRTSREVVVQMRGGEATIDRRIAELLAEPCLQIARNSVAHGIELPATRAAMGKSPVGTITLSARRTMHRLVIGIEDDGAGVDVSDVRRRAIESGAVASELAEAADDDTLLALLFLPGFSTRDSSDLLAGRGIGLDIALGSIQRMGGVLRLASRRGAGFSARVEIPVETALASVVWVEAAGTEYAIPTANASRVHLVPPRSTALPHLATCIEGRVNDVAAYALELDLEEEEDPRPVLVGVDAVGRTEEVLVRPLSSLVAAMGPYAGGIVREDGHLRLAIDVYALAPRARALGRVPEAAVSAVGSIRPPGRG